MIEFSVRAFGGGERMEANKIILNKALSEWLKEYPLLKDILEYKPVVWTNPNIIDYQALVAEVSYSLDNILDAERRLQRFASLIAKLFPETEATKGIIESELREINNMKASLEQYSGKKINGRLLLKMDSHLPIAGSIKARGGIYEVLKYAEFLALNHGYLTESDDYTKLASEEMGKFFSQYTVAVGSTGNLGLSIGIIGRALGFQVTIHMSHDAKAWKKDLLRSKGAKVIEYQADYSKAVSEGRKQAANNSSIYFIDDEQSEDLFFGYSVAALRLKEQLELRKIIVDEQHPLIVYLPCGVGGAPGGICFGLKAVFAKNVKCIFVEPTHSPSMLLGLMTDLHDKIHINDFGLDNKTEADGLAVGSPSVFVGKIMKYLLDAEYTIDDGDLFSLLSQLYETEGIEVEPSAAAGLKGPILDILQEANSDATHIVWATGGALVPKTIMEEFRRN